MSRSRGFVLVAGVMFVAVIGCADTAHGHRVGQGNHPAAAQLATPGSCGRGFADSLAVDVGGAASPVAAAEHFAETASVSHLPRGGWHELAPDDQGVMVAASHSTLHTIRGRDGTWFVDAGHNCD